MVEGVVVAGSRDLALEAGAPSYAEGTTSRTENGRTLEQSLAFLAWMRVAQGIWGVHETRA